MAGKNDRIHGYNPRYCQPAPSNFQCFNLINGRPGQFINHPILGFPQYLDHQGHIVPRALMNRVLDPLMQKLSTGVNDIHQPTTNDVQQWINNHNNLTQNERNILIPALHYGSLFNIPMFEFEANYQPNVDSAETRMGGLFSIITWNPVNICRAPDDSRRVDNPSSNIDTQVLTRLAGVNPAVNQAWFNAARDLNAIQPPQQITLPDIETYLIASASTLPQQANTSLGYYSFNWQLGINSKLEPAR